MADSAGGKYIEGLWGSTMYSIPELFGFESPRYVQEFRQDNPVAGFGSSFLGSSIPYLGYYGATKKIGMFRKIVEQTGKAKALTNPGMVGALREGVRWTPFELSRLGVNTAFGDESFGDMLASNIANMGINVAVGGVAGLVRGAGSRVKTFAEKYPETDSQQPFQIQLRELAPRYNGMQPGPEKDNLGRYLADITEQARSEKSPTGNYVSFLEGESYDDYMKPSPKTGKEKKEPQPRLQDSLFDAEKGDQTNKATVSRKLIPYPGHFADDAEIFNAIGRLGVHPQDFDKWAQFPRVLTFKTDTAGKAIKAFHDNRFTNIGDDWYIAKEANDGLYVMAKRFPGNTPRSDSWNIWKTDSPDWFRKSNAQFLSSVSKDAAWTQIGVRPIGDIGPIATPFHQWLEQYPFRHLIRTSHQLGRLAKTFDEVKASMGMTTRLTGADSEAVARVHRFFNHYITPSEFQMRHSPRGSYILNSTRALYEAAEAYTNKIFRGESNLKGNLFHEWAVNAFKGDKALHGASINQAIEKAQQGGVDDFMKVWREDPSIGNFQAHYQANKISKETMDMGQTLLENDAIQNDNIAKIKMQFEGSYSAGPNTEPALFPKMWEGEAGIPIHDKSGKIRGLAMAATGQETQADLKKILALHPDWRAGKPFNRGIFTPGDVQAVLNGKNQGVLGYKYNFTNPTIDEFKKLTLATHKARSMKQADLTQEHFLSPEMQRLNAENPHLHQIMSERLGDFRGQQRPLGKKLNEVADKLLAPIFGQESATKIAQVSNDLLFQFQLGGFNLAYLAMNILTPIQTTLPHLLYVFNGTNQIAHDMMRFTPVLRDLKPVASLGILDAFKMIGLSMGDLARPSDRLLRQMNRMVDAGYIEPQYVEEFMGEGATRAMDLRKAFASGGNFISWMRSVSNFAAANSEKFSRMTAVAMASRVAQKVLGVMDEDQEFDIIKAIVRHSMYGYKQADRAAIMTTPAGSVFGLFKNWLLHYMFWMGEYSKVAWNGGHLVESATKGYFKPLLWQQASTLGIGGLTASPLILAAEGINGLLSDDELLLNVYENMSGGLADGLMYGIPALSGKAGFGFALTSNASAPGANPIRDAQFLYTLALWDRMNYIGKGASAAIDNWMVTGQHPMEDTHVAQLFTRGLAPRWLYRSMQTIYDEGVTSLNTGYPLMKDASVVDKLMYSFGLTPIEIEKQGQLADIMYRKKEQKRALTAATARAFIEAQAAGDYNETSIILRGAIVNGLDIDSVMRSVAERQKAANEDQLTRVFDPANAAAYRRLLGMEN